MIAKTIRMNALKSLYTNNLINYIKQIDPSLSLKQFQAQTYHQAVKRELVYKILPFVHSSKDVDILHKVRHFDENTYVVSQKYDRGIDIVGDIDSTHTLLVHCKQNVNSPNITKADIEHVVGLTALYKTKNFQKSSLSILASPYTISDEALKKMDDIPMNIAYAQVNDVPMSEIPIIDNTNVINLTRTTVLNGQLLKFFPNKFCSETFSMQKT